MLLSLVQLIIHSLSYLIESTLQLWMEDCSLHKSQRYNYNNKGTMELHLGWKQRQNQTPKRSAVFSQSHPKSGHTLPAVCTLFTAVCSTVKTQLNISICYMLIKEMFSYSTFPWLWLDDCLVLNLFLAWSWVLYIYWPLDWFLEVLTLEGSQLPFPAQTCHFPGEESAPCWFHCCNNPTWGQVSKNDISHSDVFPAAPVLCFSQKTFLFCHGKKLSWYKEAKKKQQT